MDEHEITEKPVEYVNVTQGWLGANKINRKGDEISVPVESGHRVFLTAEEREMTERAHARAQDSPFTVQTIVHHNMASGEVTASFQAAPLTKASEMPDAAKGAFADGEEIGTPISA